MPNSRATEAYTSPTDGHGSINVPPASNVTASILFILVSPLGFHFQSLHEEGVAVGGFFDDFGGGFAGAVAGFGFDADEDGVFTAVSFLDGGGEFEAVGGDNAVVVVRGSDRSEEHTSELQSQSNLVCRLLLEKKNKNR